MNLVELKILFLLLLTVDVQVALALLLHLFLRTDQFQHLNVVLPLFLKGDLYF